MPVNRPFRFGVVAAMARSGEDWLAKARRAEELGYATLVIPDTASHSFAPMPALAAAAAATRTLRLGTYVLANGLRNPVLLAHECATLDFLSSGRLELGLGAGRPGADQDFRRMGLPFDSGGRRIERLAESLGIIKALLSGETVNVAGRYHTVTEAAVFPRPPQRPRPPILIAGSGKRLLALAAREADIVALGVQPNASEQSIGETIGWVREAAGDRFQELELNMNLIVVGPGLPQQALAWSGLDADELVRSGAPSILSGPPSQMQDQLLKLRDTFGVSYITVSGDFMEALAPVVATLAGH